MMRQAHWTVLVSCMVGLIAPTPGLGGSDGGADKAPHELIRSLVAQRLRWRRGHVRMVVTDVAGNMPGSNQRWDLFFDGERRAGRRGGVTFANASSEPGVAEGGPVDVLYENCGEQGTLVHFNTAGVKEGGPFALSIYDAADVRSPMMWVPDFRMLGLVPQPFQVLCTVNAQDSYAGAPEEVSVSDAELDGMQCVKLTRKSFPETRFEVWFVPSMSDAVVRAVLTSDLGTVQYVDEVQTSYSEHSGEWLPETCVYKRFIDGKENVHEEIHVTVTSINQPLPPETFELSGIAELSAGTSVNWVSSDHAPPGPPGRLVWDGSRIVPPGGVPGTIPGEEGSGGIFGSRRILVGVNVLVISLLVAVVLWLRRGRRKA